jgi:hypothetical protein
LTEQDNARTVVASFVRFAQVINGLDDIGLFENYPHLADAILDDDPDVERTANRYFALLKRHSGSVLATLERKVHETAEPFAAGRVPPDSFMSRCPSQRCVYGVPLACARARPLTTPPPTTVRVLARSNTG